MAGLPTTARAIAMRSDESKRISSETPDAEKMTLRTLLPARKQEPAFSYSCFEPYAQRDQNQSTKPIGRLIAHLPSGSFETKSYAFAILNARSIKTIFSSSLFPS